MADQTTNTTLKTLDHSRWGDSGILGHAFYNKTDGWAEINEAGHIALPFTDNWFKPSKQYICSFIYRLVANVSDGAITASGATFTSATAKFTAVDAGKTITVEGAGASGADLVTTIATYTSATEVELTDTASTTVSGANTTFEIPEWGDTQPSLEIGLWDNTAGQRKWLEGLPLALTAEVEGTPASTTSRDYFVVARDNWGETLGTNVVTVANTPADNNFSSSVYVKLAWTAVQGVIAYDVYRKTGATYHFLKSVYPTNGYQDRGATQKTVVGYPSVDYERARAYVQTNTRTFNPTDDWRSFSVNIPIPADYDQSKTTDKQWFRFGLTGDLIGAGLRMQIDLVSVDSKRGFFENCPLDFLAKRSVSSSPTSGSQGTVGTGGGGVILPPSRGIDTEGSTF